MTKAKSYGQILTIEKINAEKGRVTSESCIQRELGIKRVGAWLAAGLNGPWERSAKANASRREGTFPLKIAGYRSDLYLRE